MRAFALPLLAILALAGIMSAQSSKTVVVPAASPAVKTSQASAVSDNSASIQEMLKMLQEMKAANEETLRKQATTLQQLDDLEQAADQLKVYTKRG